MKPRKQNAFTLVELLVVITIIGMLVALVLPAVNSAREQARQVQCTNNQRSYGQAIQQFESSKQCFPGYRQLLPIQNGTNTPPSAIVSWQIIVLPNMGKTDTYQSIQSGVTGITTPLPTLDFATCPSDNSIAGKSSPWTSYVANCGRLDRWVNGTGNCVAEIAAPNIPEVPQTGNGIFFDKVLGNIAPGLGNLKLSMSDIKDGQSTTLLLAENIDAFYYCDSPIQVVPQSNFNNLPNLVKSSPNCTERGAGFVWWDTSNSAAQTPAPSPTSTAPPSSYPQAGINIQRGDWDPAGTKGWPNDFNNYSDPANYAARPASNHPGGVIVCFAGGNTKFLREDIDYPVYCLLMTPNGANAPTRSHDNTNKSWQKYFPLDEGKL